MTGRYTVRRDDRVIAQVTNRTLAYQLFEVIVQQTGQQSRLEQVVVQLNNPDGKPLRVAYFPRKDMV